MLCYRRKRAERKYHEKRISYCIVFWRERQYSNVRADYSVSQLTARFEMEERFEAEGKSINPHNKEFREALKNTINNLK